MREVIVTGKTVEEASEKGCLELGLTQDQVTIEILEMPVRKLFKTLPAKVKVTADSEEEATQVPKVQEKKQENTPPSKPEVKPAEQKKPADSPVEKKRPNHSDKAVLENEPEELILLEENPGAKAGVEYLTGLFRTMGSKKVEVKAYQQGEATLFRVEGDDIRDVIETKGDTIQALSYLTDRAVNKEVDKRDKNYLRVRLDVAGYRGRRESELVALAEKIGKQVAETKRSYTLAPMNPYERLIIHTTVSNMEGIVSESTGSDTERRVVIRSTAPDAVEGEDWNPNKKSRSGKGGGPRKDSYNKRGYSGNKSGKKNYGDRKPKTSTPEREYVNKERDLSSGPVVPERREAIKDGDDLPLYGKIEL